MVEAGIAHGWRRGLLDVGDHALMRGLATAFPRFVRGCPYLTAGVDLIGHKAARGSSPAAATPPLMRVPICLLSRPGVQVTCASWPIAHMKPTSSRATASQTTVDFLPLALSAR